MTGKQFERTRRLLGDENTRILGSKTIAIAGIGAVGGYALEALARIGIGHFILVDFDRVSESNINRQLLSSLDVIGRKKTDVASAWVKRINGNADVIVRDTFLSEENIKEMIDRPDLIVDAIDSVKSKVALIKYALENDIPVVSSMGAANKLDLTRITFADISETYGCPLARAVRTILKNDGIYSGVPVVFSPERIKVENGMLGTLSTSVAAFGIYLSHLAISVLLGKDGMTGGKIKTRKKDKEKNA